LISSSAIVTAVTNENIQLECVFEGYPIKPIRWYKGDKEIGTQDCSFSIKDYQICGRQESSKYLSEFKAIEDYKKYNGTLLIRRTTYPSDGGIYQCRAGEKDQIQKADITVDVHGKYCM